MCSTAALLSMEQQNQLIPLSQMPDYQAAHKTLEADYKMYLRNRLQEYEKTDVDMNELVAMSKTMTRADFSFCIYTVRTDEGNDFFHVATQKIDVPTIQWLYENIEQHRPRLLISGATQLNGCSQTPFDLCINQLQPYETCPSQLKNVFEILKSTINHIAQVSHSIFFYLEEYKEECLKKIIALQLAHKQINSTCIIPQELLDALIPDKKRSQQPPLITTLYQAAANKVSGDTFTHFIVEQENPDELFEWIQQGRVSCVKNNAGFSPLDLALNKFRNFTQNPHLIDLTSTGFNNTRCCLFMLLNYYRLKSEQTERYFDQCCDKHIIAQ